MAAADEEVELGPAVGPALPGPALPGGDDAYSAYAEMPFFDGDPSKVVSVSQDELRRAMGHAKQYEAALPPPPKEAKVAANVWSRSTGVIEQQYQASTGQKRKNQIQTLASQAAAKAPMLQQQRASGLKTKKETAAKYGW